MFNSLKDCISTARDEGFDDIADEATKELNDFFTTHESFMVDLCALLRLEYEMSTEDDVLKELKKVLSVL